MTTTHDPIPLDDDPEAVRFAGAFLAGYASSATRRAYRVDLRYWFAFSHRHGIHPYRGIRRTHLELYLRELEQLVPKPANTTRYRRVATLSAWFGWLEDEDLNVGNAAARVRRPIRHRRPMPWLDRDLLTDLLTAAQDEGGATYATVWTDTPQVGTMVSTKDSMMGKTHSEQFRRQAVEMYRLDEFSRVAQAPAVDSEQFHDGSSWSWSVRMNPTVAAGDHVWVTPRSRPARPTGGRRRP